MAAEIGDVMDALEVGGGDGVGAGPASNAAYVHSYVI